MGTYFYRPHPKDGGRYCFQFVCQSTPRRGRRGTPARSGWWGGGYLDGGDGYPGQVLIVGGTPASLDGGGGTPARSGWWGVPQPGLDGRGGNLTRSGWWAVPRVPPGQVWMVGVPRVPLARSGWWGYPGYP